MLDDVAQQRTSRRPTKAEPGILNLISHSRSRSSQSKGGEEAVHVDAVDVVPELRADGEPQNPHKPSELLHSRPLSAATTNTASTVTPANVTPRKRPPPRIPIATVQEEPVPVPKEVQAAPKKNFHIFGIPLSSPRKSSFGSRPTTPSEASPAPVRRKSSPSPRRAPSPTPKARAKLAKSKPKPDIGQGHAPPSRLDNLSKFFVGTGMRVSTNPEPSVAKPSSSTPAKPSSSTPAKPSSATPAKPSSSTPSKIPTLKHSLSKPHVAHISPSTIVADPITPKLAAGQPGRRYMSEVGNTARIREPATPTPAPRVLSSGTNSVGASTARARVSGTSAIGLTTLPHARTSISNPRASIVSPRTSTTGPMLSPTAATACTCTVYGVAVGDRRIFADECDHDHILTLDTRATAVDRLFVARISRLSAYTAGGNRRGQTAGQSGRGGRTQ
ncbi:hypothetical protein DFH09DRAFT_16018 [Mycena vulgaris]|nr:hypothetical protein DFH09DRAFT_16018 [Mycena vulgaris]